MEEKSLLEYSSKAVESVTYGSDRNNVTVRRGQHVVWDTMEPGIIVGITENRYGEEDPVYFVAVQNPKTGSMDYDLLEILLDCAELVEEETK